MRKWTVLMAVAALALCVSCNDKSDDEPSKTNAKTYQVGDTGPAGGIIFYVADSVKTGSYKDSNGAIQSYTWKYLEAAPSDITGSFSFGCNGKAESRSAAGSEADIGTGWSNTRSLVNSIGTTAYTGTNMGDTDTVGTNYPAYLCDNYSYGGYSDWFLPSKMELLEMYTNLKQEGKGGTWQGGAYWSSTESNSYQAIYVDFSSGLANSGDRTKNGSGYVRPARAFLE